MAMVGQLYNLVLNNCIDSLRHGNQMVEGYLWQSVHTWAIVHCTIEMVVILT